MRSLSLTIAAAAAVATGASAQQIYEIDPGITSFTSRGSVSTGSGELFQGFHSGQNRGLGDDGVGASVIGMRVVVQDQIGATAGSFSAVIRGGTDATGPLTGAGGVLFGSAPIGLPASAAPGPVAWLMTITFAAVAVPQVGFFAAGAQLAADPLWPTDGVSFHASSNVANAQHAASVDMAWQIIGAAPTASHPTSKRSWRLGLRLPQNAFQVGNVTTAAPLNRFGNGGYFPDTALLGAASQGLAFRCYHNLGAAGTAAVLMSVGPPGAPFTVLGIGNTVYLDLATLASTTLAAGPSDGTVLPFLAAGIDAVPSSAGLPITFQGVVIDFIGGTLDMTNAVVTTLL